MDFRREPRGHGRRNALIGAGVVALVAIAFAISHLQPSAPAVDRDVLLFGTVERGSFVREVRGSGTLVPEQIVHISALTGGRVEKRLAEPGEHVVKGTALLELSNPDVQLEALQSEQQLTAARAALIDLRLSLGSQVLSQEAAVANARATSQDAEREARAYEALVDRQLVTANEAQRNRERAEAAAIGLDTESRRLDLLRGTVDEQIAVQREQVRRLESITDYQRGRVESMHVVAPADGVLQDLTLEVGQWVQPGTTLARVAQPDRLKAELRIPQTQARDVRVGQSVTIDTRADSIRGRVRRVDPNVQNGFVLVEVKLEGEMPPGTRPDLSVDGTIEIERLQDVLHVDRPAYGQSNSAASLFQVIGGGDAAVRTPVRLGRSSVNRIEVLDGLQPGDRIILSDMSRWDDVDRVRIH